MFDANGVNIQSANFHSIASTILCIDGSGSGTAQGCNMSPTYSPAGVEFIPVAGDTILYETTTTNTGDLTINVDAMGAVHVRKYEGVSPLAPGDLKAGVYVLLTYDGTYWEMNNTGNLSSSIGSSYTGIAAPINGLIVQGNVGIGTSTPYSRLTLWGADTAAGTAAFTIANSASTTEFQVFDTGNATLAGSLTQNSDQRLKTNILSLDASSSLAKIEALNPVAFDWVNGIFGTGHQIGFIAQEMQQVFPELVSTTSPTALTPNGTLGINYTGLIAPMVGAIQDIAKITGDFKDNLIAWLGDASNGIHDLFAQNLHAEKELCVGDVCVTRDQFLRMVEQSGQTPTAPATATATTTTSGEGSAPAQTPAATTTPASDTTTAASTTPATSASASADTATSTPAEPPGNTTSASSTPAATPAPDTSTASTPSGDQSPAPATSGTSGQGTAPTTPSDTNTLSSSTDTPSTPADSSSVPPATPDTSSSDTTSAPATVSATPAPSTDTSSSPAS